MSETKIQKFLPNHFIEVFGPNLPALYKSVNESFENTEQLIQACIDQLFISTASGRYLLRLGEESGFTLPQGSGLDIQAYKLLAPIMISEPKQVRLALSELLKVFFNAERTRPNITSTILGPYSINSNDNLIIRTESGTVNIPFLETQVSDLSSVSATELSAIINYTQDIVESDVVVDRISGREFLRIFSKTPGTGSFIQVVGGTLQNVVKFPNVIETDNATGTTWNLEKDYTYTDLLKFTWDGLGLSPKTYLVSKGDYVTIYELNDDLNGSYEVIDSGYDYFIVRNDRFDSLSGSVTQTADNNIVFTSQEKNNIFDLPEYAFVSESSSQTVTITVPAVPPLVKRFLKGSTHLRGEFYEVVDFTRNSVEISVAPNQIKPADLNRFSISNKFQRFDFKKIYETVSTIGNIYNLRTLDDDVLFPYTVSTSVSSSPLYGNIGSDEYTLTFPYKHGLYYGWGFTLSGGVGDGNISNSDINKEHQVLAVVDDYTIKFKLKDSSGDEVKFSGIEWSRVPFDPEDWNSATIPSIEWIGSAYSPQLSRFVGVGQSGVTRAAYSDDQGQTWSTSGVTLPFGEWRSATWSPELGLFVAVAANGANRLMYSSDGITWSNTGVSLPAVSGWESVTWSPDLGLFVAVAFNGTDRIMYSFDGVTWSNAGITAPTSAWRSVTWSSDLGLFVAVADGGVNRVAYSTDGITWTAATAPTASYNEVCWSPDLGLFVAVSGTSIIRSSDGANWFSVAAPSGNTWQSVCWSADAGLFYAVSLNGTNRIMYSEDGIAWTETSSPENNSWTTISSSNSAVIALSAGGINRAMEISTNITIGHADVYRYPVIQSDQSDFYLEFPSAILAQESGLTPGVAFRLDLTGGLDADPYLANILRNRTLAVTSVSSNIVNFSAGLGAGPEGAIILGIFGTRDGFFGGPIQYYVDKSSTLNQERIFQDFNASFMTRMVDANPQFVGSFVFDPTGESGFVTPSRFLTQTTDAVFKGENISTLPVASLEVDGVDFPSSGRIVFRYGTADFEGPIRYFSVMKGPVNQIFIDPAYKFKKSHPVGSQVQYIHSASPYTPTMNGSDYPAYLTGTTEARETLFKLAQLLVATGIFIEKDVLYPELIYDDVAIPAFD